MATIEDFILKINVQGQQSVDNAAKSVDNLGKSASGFGAAGNQMTAAVGGIVRSMGGLLGIATLVATGIAAMGMKAIQLADALADISDATGISAGSLNNFKNSLIEAGGKSEDFIGFATKLTKNLGEAAIGNEVAQKSFEKLGVFVRDANGNVRDSTVVLQEVIGKLAAISDPATRSAMAVQLLGKEAAKIDWTKVNAINDPFKDEQIKQLAKYQEAIDKIGNSVTNSLITSFGKLAIAIDAASKKAEDAEKKANERGNTIKLAPFSGQPMEVPMSKSEKDRYELQQKLNEAYKDQQREMKKLESMGKQGAGDYGAESEANAKARVDYEKRIQQSVAEIAKLERLKGANEIQAIDINAQADIAKAKIEINNKERLTDQQKAAEIIVKTAEIEQKAALETAKYRSQQNAKIYSELTAQRDKSAEELAAEETRINAIVEKTRQLVVDQGKLVEQTKDRNRFNNEVALLSDRERANRKEIFDLEEQRKKTVEDIKNTSNLPYADQLEQVKGINTQFEERKRLAVEQQSIDRSLSENFQAGFQRAYANYAESARNAFEQANTYFTTFTRGFEDAWVKMIQTGKFGWKDLVNTMIAELARAQIRGTLSNLLGAVPGSTGGSGGLFGGSIIPGFLANGGAATAGKPYVVGEQGPELFVPRTSGTVVPNGALGGGGSTVVTYNISAVDAQSFKSMIARDPSFIHAVAMQGAKSIPSRR